MGKLDKLNKLRNLILFTLILSISITFTSEITDSNSYGGISQESYGTFQNAYLNMLNLPYYLRDFSMEDIKNIDVDNLTEEDVEYFRKIIAAKNIARNKSLHITVTEKTTSFEIGTSISE